MVIDSVVSQSIIKPEDSGTFSGIIDEVVSTSIGKANGRGLYAHLLQNPAVKCFLYDPENYPMDGNGLIRNAAQQYISFILQPSRKECPQISDEKIELAVLLAMDYAMKKNNLGEAKVLDYASIFMQNDFEKYFSELTRNL